jgi:hypothetical protein
VARAAAERARLDAQRAALDAEAVALRRQAGEVEEVPRLFIIYHLSFISNPRCFSIFSAVPLRPTRPLLHPGLQLADGDDDDALNDPCPISTG